MPLSMTKFLRKLSLLCLLLSGPAAAQEGVGDPGEWMAHYYENPRPGQLSEWMRTISAQGLFAKQASRFPAMTFLSEVLAQNPGEAGRWCREWADLPEMDRMVVAWSFRNSNVAAQDSCIRKDLGLDPGQVDKVLKAARHDPLTMEASSPSDLDMLWAVFMATGNPAAVHRIIDVLGRPLPEEKTRAGINALLLQGAAKWSLGSNIRQHPRVAGIAKTRLETATGLLQSELGEVVGRAAQPAGKQADPPRDGKI